MSSVNLSTEPTKPMPDPNAKPTTILAFGAHPDDIEFGQGASSPRPRAVGTPRTS